MEADSLLDSIDAGVVERHGVPGLVVGVLSRGELVAALALRLVEEGRLALDESLTGLRLPWEAITLRHLLSHQAGLAGGWAMPLDDYGEGGDAMQRLAADAVVGGPVGPFERVPA